MDSFDALTWRDIKKRLDALASEATRRNRLFLDSDHWQAGAGWSGPHFALDMLATDKVTQAAHHRALGVIQRLFVSQNVMSEGVQRHTNGVIGRAPAIPMAPREGQPDEATQTLIDQSNAALSAWWQRREVTDKLREALSELLADDRPGHKSRVVLRLIVPEGLVVEDDEGNRIVPRAESLEEALGHLWLDVAKPETALVWRDQKTRQPVGAYFHEDAETNARWVELSYRAETKSDAATVLRIIPVRKGRGEEMPASHYEYLMGGHLMHYEISRPRLLTEQVRQQQRALNQALTMLNHSSSQAMREVLFFGSAPPGEWKWGEGEEEGKLKFVPGTMSTGPGMRNFLAPYLMVGEDGQSVRAVGGASSAVVVDPVDPTYSIRTADAFRAALLAELDQLHVQITGDATASGRSRIQALADYVLSLYDTKSALDGALRWICEAALGLAAQFMGKPGAYAGLRSQAECRLDFGPIEPETMRLVIELVNAKMLSRKNGMGRIGVDDPQAETEQIRAEAEEMLGPVEAAQLERTRLGLEQDRGGADRLAAFRQGLAEGTEGAA